MLVYILAWPFVRDVMRFVLLLSGFFTILFMFASGSLQYAQGFILFAFCLVLVDTLSLAVKRFFPRRFGWIA
jgi:hypothetical protein